MTVDEILAQREYRDRCGREWNLTDYWVDRATFDYVQMWLSPDRVATPDQMRLLIERDMHRDECEGLDRCYRHPVWIVSQGFNEDGYAAWEILRPYANQGRLLDTTHAEAMDAAYTLAVDA